MAYYNYRAVDEEAKVIKGSIEAVDEQDLEQRLSSRGLSLIEATRNRFVFSSRLKLSDKDLLNFTYFLNLIMTSGMPIMSGLQDMSKQSVNSSISGAASLLQSKLESGKSISESMLEHPDLFPPFYVSMVKAGEASGNLEQVFTDMMAYLEWQIKLKKDVQAALAYPLIVLGAVVSLITILFVFIMPKLLNIINQLRVELPLPTKIVLFTVNFFKAYWPLIIVSVVVIPVLYRVVVHTARGKEILDRSMLKMPLLGMFVRKLNHSRYFRTFATLYRSGLSMNETLRLSAEVVKNSVIASSLGRVTNLVLGGEMFSSALKSSGEFTPLMLNMVEIGEKTGTLDNTVLRISEIYDKEIPETMKKIFTVLEPLMLAVLGGIVLLTLASFFLPLYKMIGGLNR